MDWRVDSLRLRGGGGLRSTAVKFLSGQCVADFVGL